MKRRYKYYSITREIKMAYIRRLKPQTAVETINHIGEPFSLTFGVQPLNGDHTVTLTHSGVDYHGRAATRKAAKEIAADKAVRGYFTTDIKVPGRLTKKMEKNKKELAAYAIGQLDEKWRREGYTLKLDYTETAKEGAAPAPRAHLATLDARLATPHAHFAKLCAHLAALRALAAAPPSLADPEWHYFHDDSPPAAAGWQYFDDD